MLAICAWLGLSCALNADLPPDRPAQARPPAVRAAAVSPPAVRAPAIRAPRASAPLPWPSCEVEPPGAMKPVMLKAARANPGVSACQIARKAWCESGFNPAAVSPANARGVMQFLPTTAAHYGIDPFDPAEAIPAAAHYMTWCRARWSPAGRTAHDIQGLGDGCCYNWGIGNCYRSQRRHGWYLLDDALPHWPRETRDYTRCTMTGSRN